jgi:hypothetical protein
MSISLSFPDATYTTANKPSVLTLKSDLSLIETDLNAHEADTTIHNTVTTLLQSVYPVGSIYISALSTNPATLFGFGTWTAFSEGRTLIGVGTSDQAFVSGASGGASTHLLTGAESGEKGHNHTQDAHAHGFTRYNGATGNNGSGGNAVITNLAGFATDNATATNQAVGTSNASSAHNNLQPYIVTYMFRRTA